MNEAYRYKVNIHYLYKNYGLLRHLVTPGIKKNIFPQAHRTRATNLLIDTKKLLIGCNDGGC